MKWLKLDCDFRNDPKIRALSKKFGGQQACSFWPLLLGYIGRHGMPECRIILNEEGQHSPSVLAEHLCIYHHKTLFNILESCANLGLISKECWSNVSTIYPESIQNVSESIWNGRIISIPNMLKRMDDYTRKVRILSVRSPEFHTVEQKEKKNTEQIQIQNPPPTPSGGPELLFKIYNEHRGSLPEAKKLTSDRLRYCRARLSQNNGSFIEDWTMSVKKAAILPFCCGESDSGWCVSFDWLIKNNTNYLKITEGKYDHGRNERPTRADKNDKTAARFMARFDPENRSGIQRGAIGSNTRGLHGKPDEGES